MPRVELRDYRKARTPFGSLLRLFRYFRHCRTIMICAVASILVYVAATIAASYCMKPLVNLLKQTGLAPSEVYAKYLALLLGLAGLYALSAVTNYLLNRLMLECSTVIMRALRTELFAKMQRLPISYFDANTNGSLMSYFTNDIEATNELLQHAITQMLISVTSLLGTIGMMLALSMKLFSLMVVLAAIVIVVVRGITKKSSRCYRQQQKDAASVNGFVEEMIAGQRDVKVFTHEKQVMQDFKPINESFYQSSAEATTVTSIVGPILNNLSHFFYALTCAVGVLWLTGENAGGVLITFLGYIRTFAERVSQISEQFNAIMLALAGAERIFDVLDMPPEVDEGEVTLEQSGRDYFWVRPDGERVPLRGDVRFYGVDFAYVPEKPVLRDLSLYAKPGQKIAFVGSTGAGKTTITNLINRFYDIQGGQITYDGIGRPPPFARYGFAGHAPVYRHGHGEHPLWPFGGHGRGLHPRREDRQRALLHFASAAGLRHHADLRRRESLAGPAPAAGDRPRGGLGGTGIDSGRGDLVRRYAHGKAHRARP